MKAFYTDTLVLYKTSQWNLNRYFTSDRFWIFSWNSSGRRIYSSLLYVFRKSWCDIQWQSFILFNLLPFENPCGLWIIKLIYFPVNNLFFLNIQSILKDILGIWSDLYEDRSSHHWHTPLNVSRSASEILWMKVEWLFWKARVSH